MDPFLRERSPWRTLALALIVGLTALFGFNQYRTLKYQAEAGAAVAVYLLEPIGETADKKAVRRMDVFDEWLRQYALSVAAAQRASLSSLPEKK